MWKGLVVPADMRWLTEAVTNTTLIFVIDGSYNLKKAPNICATGWIIHCTAEKCYISTTLIEQLDSAGSYHGELLGMLTILPILYVI